MDLRAFAFGILTGVVMWMGCIIGLSMWFGIKWQPVASAWF